MFCSLKLLYLSTMSQQLCCKVYRSYLLTSRTWKCWEKDLKNKSFTLLKAPSFYTHCYQSEFLFLIWMKETRVWIAKVIIVYRKIILILTSKKLVQHYMFKIAFQNIRKHSWITTNFYCYWSNAFSNYSSEKNCEYARVRCGKLWV